MHIRQITNLLPQPMRFGLRQFVFKGSAHACVLCGNHVREFRSHGGGADVLDVRQVVGGKRRDNDRCPVCHGSDRTRLMMMYLNDETPVGEAPQRILHAAPDFGLYLWLKRQPKVTYIGSDIDVSRYRHIENVQSADLTKMPFEDNSFDLLICSHVLEHIPDDTAAFAEMFRVVKPGGRALLLAPFALDGLGTDEEPDINDAAEQDRRFGQWDHVRLYDRGDFLKRMRLAEFDASLFDPFESDPDQAERLHLNQLELLPIGTKPLNS